MTDHRILIVDDNFMQRKLLAQHFKNMGYTQITSASSTAEASDTLVESHGKGEPFQLIMLDWHMPGMEGDQFLAMCRADTRFRAVPIIMVTAESESRNILHAMKSGATSYLVKPVSYGDLKKRVSQVLERAK